MSKKFAVLSFVSLLLFSCKKSTTANCNLTSFPSKAGNSWTYVQTILSDYNTIRDTTTYDTIHLSVVKDTIYDGKTMQKIECYSNKNPYRSFALCINENSSFVQYISEPGFISQLLRVRKPASYEDGILELGKIAEPDSTISVILSFNTDNWIYRENDLVKIEKKNLGEATITTPKGTFQCCKYQLNYLRKFFPQSIETTEFFSQKGLVRKINNSFNVDFTDGSGNLIDTGNRYESIELTDYTLL